MFSADGESCRDASSCVVCECDEDVPLYLEPEPYESYGADSPVRGESSEGGGEEAYSPEYDLGR